MPPTTAPSGSNAGLKTVVAFLAGIGVGFAFVAPVLPATVDPAVLVAGMGSDSVLLMGVLALVIIVAILYLAFQAWLFVDN